MERLEKFVHWVSYQLSSDESEGLRVGQSYLNRLYPKDVDSELFYETDPVKCWILINAREEALDKLEGEKE